MFDDESAPARTARHLYERALELQQRGALADAIRLYKQSLAHLPTAEAHTFLGWAYAGLHRLEAAIEECRLAIDLDPDFGNPYNDIGAYYIELERWDEAVPYFKEAISARRYDNREFAHFNLGRVYEHQGDWPRALACYQVAVRINWDYHQARLAARLLIGKLN
ncbi:MAG: tetratricopeptide repeat protein [Anaerolineales bacterium]